MKKIFKNKKWLSIIEVMVGIFIFSLGISAIFMVITSTLSVNTYNKNYIVAWNLAREQVELIRNIRDTNYKKYQKWNTLKPIDSTMDYNEVFTWSVDMWFLKLENDFGSEEIIANTWSIVWDFKSALQDSADTSEDLYQLCLDTQNRYWYCGGGYTIKTPFYRYIEIKPLEDWSGVAWNYVDSAFKVRSKVYWNQKWVHDTEIDTILTDWERL